MNNPHVRDPVWPRYLVIGVAVLGAAIVFGLGFGYYRVHLQQVRERARVELHALSSLKADEIRDWLEERKGDARTLAELPGVAEVAAVFAARPDDAAVKSRLEAHFRIYEANYGYTKVVLFGATRVGDASCERRDPAGGFPDADRGCKRPGTGGLRPVG